MTYVGKVSNGVVVLPPEADLPEGTEVKVEPVQAARAGVTLYERYAEFDGIFKDLPADFAENHDHYIHGAPKRTGR
jgi:hypothetical protein